LAGQRRRESWNGKRGEERERRKWRSMGLCETETKSWLRHCYVYNVVKLHSTTLMCEGVRQFGHDILADCKNIE